MDTKEKGRLNLQGKKKRARKKNIILLLKLFFLLAIVISGLLLFMMSPLFTISSITVTGNQKYDQQAILDCVQLQKGENLFKVNLNKAAEQLRITYPYISKASIRRKLPSTVVIDIEERTPMGRVSHLGAFLIIDSTGIVLETLSQNESSSLPEIRGLGSEGYEVGKKLKLADESRMRLVLALYGQLEKIEVLPKVTVIDVADLENIGVEIESRIRVNLGTDKNLSYKMSFLREILVKNLNKGEKGTLDISDPARGNFIPQK